MGLVDLVVQLGHSLIHVLLKPLLLLFLVLFNLLNDSGELDNFSHRLIGGFFVSLRHFELLFLEDVVELTVKSNVVSFLLEVLVNVVVSLSLLDVLLDVRAVVV